MRDKVRLGLLALLAMAVVLSGCAAPRAETKEAAVPTDLPEAPPLTISVYDGRRVLKGDTADLDDLLALNKPLVLTFFGGQCPTCRTELPHIQAVHNRLGEEVIFVAVDVGPLTGLGTPDDGQLLLETQGVTFPSGLLTDFTALRSYGILGVPSTALVTPSGHLADKWIGPAPETKLKEMVEDLIDISY